MIKRQTFLKIFPALIFSKSNWIVIGFGLDYQSILKNGSGLVPVSIFQLPKSRTEYPSNVREPSNLDLR